MTEQRKGNVNLTVAENERALKGVYESFMKAGKPKADIDSYSDWVKPHIKPIGGPAKGNPDCKGNYDLRGKMEGDAKLIITLYPDDVRMVLGYRQ